MRKTLIGSRARGQLDPIAASVDLVDGRGASRSALAEHGRMRRAGKTFSAGSSTPATCCTYTTGSKQVAISR